MGELLKRLEKQTIQPDEILIIDSSSEDETLEIARKCALARTVQIRREQFNHGGTRDYGLRQTHGEIILFMTQDAWPADEHLIQKLIAPLLEHETVAGAYARQIPRPEASAVEKLFRSFNYPPQSDLHSMDRLKELGIRTFFCSDACAAFWRREYEELGGFETDVISNEDMFFAARAIRNGYQIAYAADALVIHSHQLTLREQYKRNLLQGYEIARHRELLGENSSAQEGIRMLKESSRHLIRQGELFSLMNLFADCGARFLGSRAGRRLYARSQLARFVHTRKG